MNETGKIPKHGFKVKLNHKFPEKWNQTIYPRWNQLWALVPMMLR